MTMSTPVSSKYTRIQFDRDYFENTRKLNMIKNVWKHNIV